MNCVVLEKYEVILAPRPPQPATARPVFVDPAFVDPWKTPPSTLAGRDARLAAALMDGLLALAPLACGFVMTPAWAAKPPASLTGLGLWGLASLAVIVVQAILLSIRGQSVGKMALGVRIVDYENETNPGFLRVIVLRSFVRHMIGIIPLLGKWFILADLLCIFGRERRCLHDLIAGTKVVEYP